ALLGSRDAPSVCSLSQARSRIAAWLRLLKASGEDSSSSVPAPSRFSWSSCAPPADRKGFFERAAHVAANTARRLVRVLFRRNRSATVQMKSIGLASEVNVAGLISIKRQISPLPEGATTDERLEHLRTGLNAAFDDIARQVEEYERRLADLRSELTNHTAEVIK